MTDESGAQGEWTPHVVSATPRRYAAGAHLVANGVADVQILNYFSDETVPVDTALYLSYRAKEDIQKV